MQKITVVMTVKCGEHFLCFFIHIIRIKCFQNTLVEMHYNYNWGSGNIRSIMTFLSICIGTLYWEVLKCKVLVLKLNMEKSYINASLVKVLMCLALCVIKL